MPSPSANYDVLVIGGGAAGLNGALALGRARRSVLVVDAGEPRNAPAEHAHNFLTREGSSPGDILRIGREEVASYGVRFQTGAVVATERRDTGFAATLADGTQVTARRILLATGLRDELPAVEGLAAHWGRSVLHCPYCHGWEVRDEPIAVLGGGPLSVHQVLMWRQWTDQLTYVVHDAPPLADDDRERFEARGIRIVEGRAIAVVSDDADPHQPADEGDGPPARGAALTGLSIDDGQVLPVRAVVVSPTFTARIDGLEGIGLVVSDFEMMGVRIGTHVATDATGATDVVGVWAAGNVTDASAQIIGAAAAGLKAGAHINADLIATDTADAVAARRAEPKERAAAYFSA